MPLNTSNAIMSSVILMHNLSAQEKKIKGDDANGRMRRHLLLHKKVPPLLVTGLLYFFKERSCLKSF